MINKKIYIFIAAIIVIFFSSIQAQCSNPYISTDSQDNSIGETIANSKTEAETTASKTTTSITEVANTTETTTENISQLLPVEIYNNSFTIDRKPFRFIGANAINFGYYNEYGLSIEEAIKAASENGISVIRIMVGLGEDTWGGKPFEEYDKVLDISAKHGVYVIVTLTDCCCLGGEWGPTEEAYFDKAPYCNLADPSGLSSFKDYIKSVLLRKNTINGKIYKDDTTIIAWDIVNEPALQIFTDSDLNSWLIEVTSYIKTLDTNHLITIGIDTSRSLYDSDGPHYEALNVPDLDFFSFHYNLYDYSIVSGHLDLIKFRTEKFISMGKPVVLEEFGIGSQRVIDTEEEGTLDNWLLAYKQQMDTVFSAGASGAIFWGWGVPETRTLSLWWRYEDHDVTETEFCTMIKEYEFPSYIQS
ncbi:MAG: hypothetical protein FJW61_01860 [Actinobacteria bacterium]|nr:hypothetical protein [Actinomycetota bacterium]MBM3709154.1 hypothetical protein [Actinomycetota bacterium]